MHFRPRFETAKRGLTLTNQLGIMASVFSLLRRTALRSRIPSSALPTRYLNSSAILRASEASGGMGFDGPSVPLYDRLHASPFALAAMEDLAKLIKSKSGVDLQAGDAPSLALMGQLANDPELRSAAQK